MPWKDLYQFGYDKDYGSINFNNTVEVQNPKEADFIYIPVPYRDSTPPLLTAEKLQSIVKFLDVDERRCVLFDIADDEMVTDLNPNIIFIRCNIKPWMRRRMPRCIAWPWPTETTTYEECWPVSETGFKYDVSARMWLSTNVRINSCNSLKNVPGLTYDMETYPDFTGYCFDQPEGIRRRKEFRRSMRESRLALCPLSIWNVFPYRVTEAFAAKRVPIIVGDNFEYPWADRIPYKDFTIQVSIEDCHKTGTIVKNWLSNHSDEQIIKMGEMGYEYWNKWLNRDKWSDLWPIAIEERLRKDGLYNG